MVVRLCRAFAGLGICVVILVCAWSVDARDGVSIDGQGGWSGALPNERVDRSRVAESSAPSADDGESLCAAVETVEDIVENIDEHLAISRRLSDFADRHARPVEELLDGPALERYRALIAAHECEAARNLIVGPYVRAHPAHACLFRSSQGRSAWNTIASHRYPELQLCADEDQFAEAVAQMAREGIQAAPYTPDQFGGAMIDPPPLRRRNAALLSLFGACFLSVGYPPACVSYARIALTTDHLALTEAESFYALELARQRAGDDPEIARLRAMVEPKLSEERRTTAQEYAREVVAGEAAPDRK